MIIDALEPLAVPVDTLTLLPGNPRRGDVDAVARSLETFGQRKPIVAKADGTVIAGNHTLQAAKQLGWDTIAVVRVDDDDTTAKAFALADNRTAELGGYDEQALADLIREVGDVDAEMLAATGWGDDAVAALLASLEPEQLPMVQQPDDVPSASVGKTFDGDVWVLGPHRLKCGDATKRDHVEQLLEGRRPVLMVTDPPYGVSLGSATKTDSAIRGDRTQAAIPLSFATAVDVLDNNARVYLFGGSLNWAMYGGLFDHYLNMEPRVIVWDKGRFVLRHNGYHSQFELVYYGWKGKGGGPDYWYGDRKTSDVWRVEWDSDDRVHPTQKPVDLCEIAIRNSSPPGGLVYEPFGGSGTTLIAAHRLARVAAVMELDPRYCDVICKRWQKATGVLPVAESTGNAHDFCADDADAG